MSWYDSLLLAAALEGDCERLYREDFQHGRKIQDMRIENPFA
jgi:predicted nucleic acid-binding protein